MILAGFNVGCLVVLIVVVGQAPNTKPVESLPDQWLIGGLVRLSWLDE
jgi:hypothetical protein